MKTLMSSLLAFAAMIATHAPGALAQTFGTPTTPKILEGTAQPMYAVAVTSVTENTTNRTIAIGVRLLDQSQIVFNLQYAGPTPARLVGADPLELVVAGLVKKVATAKMNDSSHYYNLLVLTNLHYRSTPTLWGSTVTYTVRFNTEFTLWAYEPTPVPSVDSGSNTRGGLSEITVFAGGTRDIEGNTLACYGRLTLRRLDGPYRNIAFDFPCYPLAVGATIATPDGPVLAGPLSPTANATFHVNKLFDDVLAAPHVLVFSRTPAVIKINNTRFVMQGSAWGTQLQ